MGEVITEQPVMHISDGGVKEWRLNGKRHRADGPAYIGGNIQTWYLNGKRHRADGPAYINGDYQEWCLNGENYTFNEWLVKLKATPEEKTMLRLKWAK